MAIVPAFLAAQEAEVLERDWHPGPLGRLAADTRQSPILDEFVEHP
jgi:hypothetical protein